MLFLLRLQLLHLLEHVNALTLKRWGEGGGGGDNFTTPVVFSKMYLVNRV